MLHISSDRCTTMYTAMECFLSASQTSWSRSMFLFELGLEHFWQNSNLCFPFIHLQIFTPACGWGLFGSKFSRNTCARLTSKYKGVKCLINLATNPLISPPFNIQHAWPYELNSGRIFAAFSNLDGDAFDMDIESFAKTGDPKSDVWMTWWFS